ncbi:hypothetical protein EJ08DRAFT_95194 [Tothia fuscella]|uniref:Heterokaryon incompatibility domain-containing protein n=1 Tax=Tothia fuscella TaxID=1048955 RepID=A0A9P4NWZ1_9PEZI|nr:hypothetical protein EJ08DRAFT_95194 [Tothia fuscella]
MVEDFPAAAVCAFMDRPYWRRIWTLQEFVITSNLELVCGNARISFARFHGAMLSLPVIYIYVVSRLATQIQATEDYTRLPYVLALSEAHNKGAHTLCGMRKNYWEDVHSEKLGLFRLLARIHVEGDRKATQSVDNILGLLAMASDRAQYEKLSLSCTSVYICFARSTIACGNIDLLSLCQAIDTDNKRVTSRSDLPSWVPDWRSRIHDPLGQLPWDTNFNACGNRAAQHINDHKCGETQITLQGCIVDTVEATEFPWTPGPDGVTKELARVTIFLDCIMKLCAK